MTNLADAVATIKKICQLGNKANFVGLYYIDVSNVVGLWHIRGGSRGQELKSFKHGQVISLTGRFVMGLQVDEKVDLAGEAFAANGATEGLAFDVLGNVVIVVADVVIIDAVVTDAVVSRRNKGDL